MDGLTTTYQGAESRMYGSILNNIRNVEPQQMIFNFIRKERDLFLRRISAALAWNGPVPPHVDNNIAHLMERERTYYLPSVRWLGSHGMEATVRSMTDKSNLCTLILTSERHFPEMFCNYSTDGTGYPCLHDVSVIMDKFGFHGL